MKEAECVSGISILVSARTALLFEHFYQNNKSVRNTVDAIGNELDKAGKKVAEGIHSVGQAISGVADAVNPMKWKWG